MSGDEPESTHQQEDQNELAQFHNSLKTLNTFHYSYDERVNRFPGKKLDARNWFVAVFILMTHFFGLSCSPA